ncbi:MAG: endo-1,4-beta-xylanase [Bryobacteraceae bacterium]
MSRKWLLLLLLGSPWMKAQTLKEWGAMRRILIGAAVDPSRFSEAAYASTLRAEFSKVTPENLMKWDALHPGINTYNYAPADSIVTFATQNSMQVRGHTLVWHSQNPAWLTGGGFTPTQLSGLLQDHINNVVGHYAGKVYAWDVVNEAFNDDGTLRATIWSTQPGIGLTGTGYIEQAFRWARAADPNALLFYNDYSIETVGAKSNAVFQMVQDFKARGVPIDGIGLQTHLSVGFNSGAITSLENNIKRFADLGLQVHITELDVRLPVSGGVATPADVTAQEAIYEGVVRACLKYPLCTAIQVWGVTDKYSWIPGAFPGFGSGLPFDANYARKSAYTSMITALSTAPPIINGTGLVNAASYAAGGVSPGEIAVFFTPSFGPASLVAAIVDSNFKLPTTLAESRVLFDGTPAPLLYSLAGQVSAIVPFGVAGKASTQVQYQYKGISSNTVTVPVVAVKPGLFTLNASGSGPGAILDASYKPIGADNPAAKGSVVLVFLTGGGKTDPGIDGQVSTGLPLPSLTNVSARIGGVTADVLYAGGAVGLVHGGIQFNVRVPEAAPSGDQPIIVTIGGQQSKSGVTLRVQ